MRPEYNFEDSLERIDQKLISSLPDKPEVSIPTSDRIQENSVYLTYATVMVVKINSDNINSSEKLSDKSALLAFISEAVKIGQANANCRDVAIMENKILYIYDTTYKTDLENTIDDAAKIRTLSLIVSQKAKTKGLSPIKINIGLDYGKLIMLPADLHPSWNQYTWFGEPLQNAERTFYGKEDVIGITHLVWKNLNEKIQKYFSPNGVINPDYTGKIFNVSMNNWLTK